MSVTANIHSIQSMGTLDGPGVRFVVFLQGCPLRCKCCHNPDTWEFGVGKEHSAEELVGRALRYREYFGSEGGVTLSGGEPLMQVEFAIEFFKLCHEKGLNTCLDTSGCVLNGDVKELLSFTDRVLLDIKYTSDGQYKENVGCGIDTPLAFLDYLREKSIPTTLRQVIIPTVNDSEENILALKKLVGGNKNVDKVELLPFRKICQVKYDSMGIEFPFGKLPEPTGEVMRRLEKILKE